MVNFENQLQRMKDLMGCSVNEDTNKSNYNIEYHTVGADGKVYGIIRENAKYYIKTTDKGNENIAESYDYIGGFCNRKDHEYSSYTVAAKQLEMKMMSVNEAVGKHVNVEVLNPDKKEDLVIEATENMKKEIARQRQIMENAAAILGEESGAIGFNNTGVPEAPKTANSAKEVCDPFTEKATAKLDKDLSDKATDSKKQGDPFDENGEATDNDMKSDKAPKGGKDDYEDAKFVPDNSVANKKPSGGKAVKMNENCEDWGSCGLPDDEEAGTGDNLPDIMGELNTNDIVGQDDQLADDETLDDNTLGGDEVLGDDVLNDTEDDVMSDEEFEELLNSSLSEDVEDSEITDDDDDEDEWWNEFVGKYGNTSEAKTNRLINSIVESVTKKILGEAEEGGDGKGTRGYGVGILSRKWFTTDRQYMPFFKKYQSLVDNLRAMKHSDSPEEVNSIYESSEKTYLLLKRVVKTLSQGGKLNMKPEEYNALKQALETGTPEDAQTFLRSLDDVWAQLGSVWDDKYAADADAEFDSANADWNQHKVNDLGFSANDGDDLDSVERRDREYDMEEGTIKEETTVLHDFGKHPGYRKKPMTLPDSGPLKDEPFGKQIGSSAPFDEKVKMITDAVMCQLKGMKKKS